MDKFVFTHKKLPWCFTESTLELLIKYYWFYVCVIVVACFGVFVCPCKHNGKLLDVHEESTKGHVSLFFLIFVLGKTLY